MAEGLLLFPAFQSVRVIRSTRDVFGLCSSNSNPLFNTDSFYILKTFTPCFLCTHVLSSLHTYSTHTHPSSHSRHTPAFYMVTLLLNTPMNVARDVSNWSYTQCSLRRSGFEQQVLIAFEASNRYGYVHHLI